MDIPATTAVAAEPSSLPAQPAAPAQSDRWTAWDKFLQATPETGFMQASWWADFRAHVGYEHFAIILRHEGAILGGALVQKFPWADGNCFYYIQDGPVLPKDESDAAEVFAAIINGIEDHRRNGTETISHLRIEPRWPRMRDFAAGFQPTKINDTYFEPRTTLCVAVRPSDEEILNQMKPKGRYNIRVAQRHGVSVVEDNSERGLADFLRMYADMVKRQGINGKPAYYFETLVPILWSVGHGSLFFAEYGGQRLASALVIFFGQTAVYFYGASLDEHRNVMAPYVLHFEIMRKARARGHTWYDFWGVCPENEPEHPWQHFSTFKRKFGGVEFNIVPTLDYVYDSAAYERYAAEQA